MVWLETAECGIQKFDPRNPATLCPGGFSLANVLGVEVHSPPFMQRLYLHLLVLQGAPEVNIPRAGGKKIILFWTRAGVMTRV